ncbi:MAG: hypothetical protein V3U02_02335 [Calditrichia bacterium]
MTEKSRIAELEFIKYLSANPDSSIYEISKGLGGSYGKTYAIFQKDN